MATSFPRDDAEAAPRDIEHEQRVRSREALANRGIPFDEQRALDCIRKGDLEAVRLFLAAGVSPNATDASGTPALVLAAIGGHDDVCQLLVAGGANVDALVSELRRKRSKKDRWEKLAALSGVLTFVSTLAVASVGWYFTNAYNERQQENARHQAQNDADIRRQQARISEMDTVVKMIPHLTQGEQSKRAALLALSALATPDLATQMAQLFGGVGSVQALQTIATQQQPGSKTGTGAVAALAGIANQPGSEAAAAASEALAGIFQGRERAVVSLLQGGQMFCNGFVTDWHGPVIVTPAYCVHEPGTRRNLTIRTWDNKVVGPESIQEQGAVGMIIAGSLETTFKLPLAQTTPAIGSRLLEVAFTQADLGKVSVVSGFVEAVSTTVSAPEPDSAGVKREVLSVRVPKTNREHSGLAGGPFLDPSGAAACMVYLSAAESSLEMCLPSTTIRGALQRPRGAAGS